MPVYVDSSICMSFLSPMMLICAAFTSMLVVASSYHQLLLKSPAALFPEIEVDGDSSLSSLSIFPELRKEFTRADLFASILMSTVSILLEIEVET